jgi:hypothetical protein
MIDKIFTDIQARVTAIKDAEENDVIKHFDLWNKQVAFIEEETPFLTPAVFLEILPIKWDQLGGNLQQAVVTIKLHIVTQWFSQTAKNNPNQADAIKYLALPQQVFDVMNKFTIEGSNQFVCTDSVPNHNHERYVDSVEVYQGLVQRQAQQGNYTEKAVTPVIQEKEE